MGTPNTQHDYRVRDLFKSEHEEDRVVAKKAIELVVALVARIKPIIQYVDCAREFWYQNEGRQQVETLRHQRQNTRAILVWAMGQSAIFLTRQGELIRTFRGRIPKALYSHERDIVATQGENAWTNVSFGEFLDGLRRVLERATAKREERVAVMRQRVDAINRALAELEKPSEGEEPITCQITLEGQEPSFEEEGEVLDDSDDLDFDATMVCKICGEPDTCHSLGDCPNPEFVTRDEFESMRD